MRHFSRKRDPSFRNESEVDAGMYVLAGWDGGRSSRRSVLDLKLSRAHNVRHRAGLT